MELASFKWLNESEMIVTGDEIAIYAPARTDYFNNPIPENGKFAKPQGNAPFFYEEIEGDFVLKAKVRPNCFRPRPLAVVRSVALPKFAQYN
jgi:hypothetical protein